MHVSFWLLCTACLHTGEFYSFLLDNTPSSYTKFILYIWFRFSDCLPNDIYSCNKHTEQYICELAYRIAHKYFVPLLLF